MDSPPQLPAREAGARPERHNGPEDQQSPGQPSRNGNPGLSAPPTQLPDQQIAIAVESSRARHPVFTIAFVVLALYLGVVVVTLPWRDAWLENSLLDSFPALHTIFANNFVRGLVSGLGVLDIWAAVSEAVSYRRATAARN